MTEYAKQKFLGKLPVNQGLVILVEDLGQTPGLPVGHVGAAIPHGAGHLHPTGDLGALGLAPTPVAVHLHGVSVVLLRVSNNTIVAIGGFGQSDGGCFFSLCC